MSEGYKEGSSEFLDKYLAHLERRDSREGATKWALVAAIAAVAWQLSNVFKDADTVISFKLLGGILILYYLLERCGELLQSNSNEHISVRFLPRESTRQADAKYISAVAARTAITAVLFFFYTGKDAMQGRQMYVWMAVIPIAIVALALWAMLAEIAKEYDVRKKMDFGFAFRFVIFIIFVAPVGYGVYGLISEGNVLADLLKKENIKSVQVAGLCFAILFLMERYAKALRVDGEAAAVRRIWRRHGIGEIGDQEAMNRLRLVVVGASLNDVISSEINRFSETQQALDEMCSQAARELDKLKENGKEYDEITKGALLNSLQKRSLDISESLQSVISLRDDLVVKLKKLLSDDELKDSDAQALKAELDSGVAKSSQSCGEVISRIQGLS